MIWSGKSISGDEDGFMLVCSVDDGGVEFQIWTEHFMLDADRERNPP